MKKSLVVLALLAIFWPTSLLAGVGQSYEEFKKSDLWAFFRMAETERFELLNGHLFVRCKPGAFQEFIDLELLLSKTGNVEQGNLYLARSWIANAKSMNPFAIDIAKSFITGMVVAADQAKVEPLTTQIAKGPAKPPHEGFLAYVGRQVEYREVLSGSVLAMRNCRIANAPWLFIMVTGKDVQLPHFAAPQTPDSSLFLGEKELQPFGVKSLESKPNPHMKMWTNSDAKADISRIIDIRWLFPTAADAQYFHVTTIRENSESSQPVTQLNIPSFGQNLLVFMRGSDDPMLKAMKLDMHMYYFLFYHDKVVAKVFIAGSSKLKLEDAAKIGRLAAEMLASGKESKDVQEMKKNEAVAPK
jgi:hypothetical protein